ncbi:hypothetical protein BX285_1250 [Streptomyces sp. 1114.5]|uniref:hypothetical protein n=1 Tax=Streptomyces sp. 1114.5 TaxID=1938830 RepID=UPI000EB3A72A|nr:hypothetical protein [Streptomyces sp. 1114.5]RKT16894.1 hypothetical protein BX285_1250 [Streptomyces sp. 1114.5]
MTALTDQADAAHALLMLLLTHEHAPQPEFELFEYMTDSGDRGWGVTLVVRNSLTRFEQWRAALGIHPDATIYSACSHGACLVAVGKVHDVPVKLFAVTDTPGQ